MSPLWSKKARCAGDINAGLEPPNAPPREELLAFIESFPHWYQRVYLGHGLYTMSDVAFHEVVWTPRQGRLPR